MNDPHREYHQPDAADRQSEHNFFAEISEHERVTPRMERVIDDNALHPMEYMEPQENEYREAARHFAFMMNRAMIHIITAANKPLAAWQVAYAFGLPVCEGMSMTDRAKKIPTPTCHHCGDQPSTKCGKCGEEMHTHFFERATMSKGCKQFQRSVGLTPSEHMKSAESTAAYSKARRNQLK